MHLRPPAARPARAVPAPARRALRRARAAPLAAVAAALGMLAGCGGLPELPMQRAAPAAWAPGLAGEEACVVENPAVGLDLLASLRASLAERGFFVRQLPAGSPPTTCPTTVFYTASWSRDASARVLATAQLRVWRGGRPGSEAIYDATRSSVLDLRRYRSPEARIDSMVGQLFPARAAVVPVAAPSMPPVATAPGAVPAIGAAPPGMDVPGAAPGIASPVVVIPPGAVPAPAPVPVPIPTPIFIPGPGEPPVPAPVPTSPLAPGGAGRGSTPF
jgi:hypothetical protein